MELQHVSLEEFEAKLAALSLEDLQTLSAECLDDLEEGRVPATGKPVLDAITRELTARYEMLKQQSAELDSCLLPSRKRQPPSTVNTSTSSINTVVSSSLFPIVSFSSRRRRRQALQGRS